MSIEYKKNLVNFKDVVSVDEAEGLLEWLQKKRQLKSILRPVPISILLICRY